MPRPFAAFALVTVVALSATAFGQRTPTGARTSVHTPAPAHPTTSAHPATRPTVVAVTRKNPLLPAAVDIAGFYPEIALLQKLPAIAPQGFDPLYTSEDWQAYRAQYGGEADALPKQKSSGQLAFAEKLIAASNGSATSGLKRLLLIRAAAIAYRTKDGFTTADKAVAAYQQLMDKSSATQVGALWALANTMSRTAVTPKPERIHYDSIAAKANMQLSLLLLNADQIEAAQAVIKQVAYHEGWLKFDKGNGNAIKAQIAQVRARVMQVAKMMDYLGTQYEPAVNNDANALLIVYLYGRYVKNNPTIVADLPGRVPGSPLAKLATSIDAAAKDPTVAFAAAENLRIVAAQVPDTLIRQRTLFASLQNYRTFLNSPLTERDRNNRTLGRIALEHVISDGAHGPVTIDPFAAPAPAVPAPAPTPELAPAPATQPPAQTEPIAVGMAFAG